MCVCVFSSYLARAPHRHPAIPTTNFVRRACRAVVSGSNSIVEVRIGTAPMLARLEGPGGRADVYPGELAPLYRVRGAFWLGRVLRRPPRTDGPFHPA